MIYNLKKELNGDIIENGVYESLTRPRKGTDCSTYIDNIRKEIKDCPFLHCPDYELLVPLYDELKVITEDGNFVPVMEFIETVCFFWWSDENRV